MLAGLVIGGAAWWFGDGPLAMASARIADEVYTQRPACRKARVARHRVLHLRMTVPQSIVQQTKMLRIDDPASGKNLDLVIEGIPAPDQGGFVLYHNKFGKDIHRETWRPFCEFGRCAVSLNYHAPNAVRDQATNSIKVSFVAEQDATVFTANVRDVPSLWATQTPAYMYPQITGNPAATGKIMVMSGAQDLDVTLQLGQGTARREQHAILSAGTPPITMTVPPSEGQKTDYAGIYAAWTDLWRQHVYEYKLEWINEQDEFMRCPAGGNEPVTDAAPATQSPPMTKPDAPQIPVRQK